jgi:hypothetical protein
MNLFDIKLATPKDLLGHCVGKLSEAFSIHTVKIMWGFLSTDVGSVRNICYKLSKGKNLSRNGWKFFDLATYKSLNNRNNLENNYYLFGGGGGGISAQLDSLRLITAIEKH